MRILRGEEFRHEREAFDFRFCCEDCVYFDRQEQRCAHGWPCDEHRLAHYAEPLPDELVFCKEFELG